MILVDGKPMTMIPADDRGLAYGDGLFETIEIIKGRPVLWARHMQRLQHGCQMLGIPYPGDEILLGECLELGNIHGRGIIKIILTRGSGGRGYRPDATCQSRRIISFHSWPDLPEKNNTQGIRLFRCKTPISINKKLAGLKTLCRLDQVLAQMEWDEQHFSEGLMTTSDEQVIEGTKTNVFMVKNGLILTPGLKTGGIKGIMRDVIIDMAQRSNMAIQEVDLSHDEFVTADEIFVCNSIIKIWPVTEYLDSVYPFGVCTKKIMRMIEAHPGEYE